MNRTGNTLLIGRFKIKASRWPWQRREGTAMLGDRKTEAAGTLYGWRGTPGMGRFGGGWNWCVGFRAGGSSIILELLIGMITISWYRAK